MPEEKKELTQDEILQNQLDDIKNDLNSNFPFAALWQDEQETSLMKIVPLINLIATGVVFILLIILLIKK